MRNRLVPIALLLVDFCIVLLVPYLALVIRFEGDFDSRLFGVITSYLPAIVVMRLAVFYLFGLYHRLWRYAGISEMLIITGAVTLSSLLLMLYSYLTGATLPRSIHILSWLMSVIFIGGSRVSLRVLCHLRQRRAQNCTNVLIIGAGDAGAVIAREIRQRQEPKVVVGFIDDDRSKQDMRLNGIKVLGGREDIATIVESHSVKEIIIAMPAAGGAVIRDTLNLCKQTGCQVTIVPGIYELVDGQVTVQQLRKVNLEDLLRREPIKLDTGQIEKYLTGKRVLVTGAGGSIGSELCRQIAKFQPSLLVLVGKGENSIYEIHRELLESKVPFSVEPVIADVRDQDRIHSVFSAYRPQVVFHAAAHKHVPLMELQPEEAVRNNIFGTRTVASAANEFGAEKFVMISTDKAVNPTSVMGATKRAAELVIQSMNAISKTDFVAVRFGNVLGSRGSVVPLFRQQIARGGPVTITHPEMKRYFMTIPEASQLVLQAGAIAKGGEVFVLDMGEPIKIVDMAHDLIELSGFTPDRDIEIQFTGLRPGEKLFEELLTAEEGTTATKHKKIFTANLKMVDTKQLQRSLLELLNATDRNEVIAILEDMVPNYAVYRKQQVSKSEVQENADSHEAPAAQQMQLVTMN